MNDERQGTVAMDVMLPRLSTGADEVTWVRWLCRVGSRVSAGEPLAEVETDKATVEFTAPQDGYVRALLVQEGDRVPVGARVAELSVQPEEAPTGVSMDGGVEAVERLDRMPPTAPDGRRPRVSPYARRLARQLGVPLTEIDGSGPRGRIVAHDVEAAARRRQVDGSPPMQGFGAPRQVPGVRRELDAVRRAMARQMVLSASQVPQFSVARRADVTALLSWREAVNAKVRPEQRLSVVDFVLVAVSAALRRHPEMNSSFVDTDSGPFLYQYEEVHIGLATATERGLLVPVIRNADTLGLLGMAQSRRQAVQRANAGHLLAEELDAATFTVSNLGPFEVERFTALVNPPEAGILAVGAVQHSDSDPRGRHAFLELTLSADHRVVDGAQAARFLATVVELLAGEEGYDLS